MVTTSAVFLLLIAFAWMFIRRRRLRRAPPDAARSFSNKSESPTNRGRPRQKSGQTSYVPPPLRVPESLAQQASASIRRVIAMSAEAASNERERTDYAQEAEDTVLALMAAVVLADGVIHPDEWTFLKQLVKNLDTPDQCREFVQPYSEKWSRICREVPRFFAAVVEFDRMNHTFFSRDIIAELKHIVATTALADGDYADCEAAIVAEHFAVLDAVFRKALWVVQWDEKSAPPRVPLERSYRREDFAN